MTLLLYSCGVDCKTWISGKINAHFPERKYSISKCSCGIDQTYALIKVDHNFVIKSKGLFISSSKAKELLYGKIPNTYFGIEEGKVYIINSQPKISRYAYYIIELDTNSRTIQFFSNYGD